MIIRWGVIVPTGCVASDAFALGIFALIDSLAAGSGNVVDIELTRTVIRCLGLHINNHYSCHTLAFKRWFKRSIFLLTIFVGNWPFLKHDPIK